MSISRNTQEMMGDQGYERWRRREMEGEPRGLWWLAFVVPCCPSVVSFAIVLFSVAHGSLALHYIFSSLLRQTLT
jgi:hypothetical protein